MKFYGQCDRDFGKHRRDTESYLPKCGIDFRPFDLATTEATSYFPSSPLIKSINNTTMLMVILDLLNGKSAESKTIDSTKRPGVPYIKAIVDHIYLNVCMLKQCKNLIP